MDWLVLWTGCPYVSPADRLSLSDIVEDLCQRCNHCRQWRNTTAVRTAWHWRLRLAVHQPSTKISFSLDGAARCKRSLRSLWWRVIFFDHCSATAGRTKSSPTDVFAVLFVNKNDPPPIKWGAQNVHFGAKIHSAVFGRPQRRNEGKFWENRNNLYNYNI